MLITELLKDYRIKKKLTGRQLASKIGMDYHAYWRFEQGRPLQQRHFQKLVGWLLTA